MSYGTLILSIFSLFWHADVLHVGTMDSLSLCFIYYLGTATLNYVMFLFTHKNPMDFESCIFLFSPMIGLVSLPQVLNMRPFWGDDLGPRYKYKIISDLYTCFPKLPSLMSHQQ